MTKKITNSKCETPYAFDRHRAEHVSNHMLSRFINESEHKSGEKALTESPNY